MNKYVNGVLTPMTDEEVAEHIAQQPTAEQIEADRLETLSNDINNAVSKVLNDQAKALRYDDINSIAKYIGYVNPYQVEAEKLGLWTATCWETVATIEADFLAGGSEPTIDGVIASLPIYGA